MISLRARARVATITVALLALARSTDAGPAKPDADAPPEGWRAPAATKAATTEPEAAPARSFIEASDVFVKDLPEGRTRAAGKGDRPVLGAPKLAMFDGRGLPAPWKDGPKDEIRFAPPGAYGTIEYERAGRSLFFAPPSLREQGQGAARVLDHEFGQPLPGNFTFVSLSPLPDGRLAFDSVEGRTNAALTPIVRTWTHADAVPLAGGRVFAFREDRADGEVVRLVAFNNVLTLPAGRGAASQEVALLFDHNLDAMKVLGLDVKNATECTLVFDTSRGASEPSATLHIDVSKL